MRKKKNTLGVKNFHLSRHDQGRFRASTTCVHPNPAHSLNDSTDSAENGNRATELSFEEFTKRRIPSCPRGTTVVDLRTRKCGRSRRLRSRRESHFSMCPGTCSGHR